MKFIRQNVRSPEYDKTGGHGADDVQQRDDQNASQQVVLEVAVLPVDDQVPGAHVQRVQHLFCRPTPRLEHAGTTIIVPLLERRTIQLEMKYGKTNW